MGILDLRFRPHSYYMRPCSVMSCHDDVQLPSPSLVNGLFFLVSVVHTAAVRNYSR